MSVFLTMFSDQGESHASAETGNLVHSAAAEFHRAVGSLDLRTEAGLRALDAARGQFPRGDPKKAEDHFRRYAGDPTNAEAVCRWVEQPVVLELDPAPDDPTGEPVVVGGTLDQVRLTPSGSLEVWDIKTGSGKDADESTTEYALQQAAYVLAARQTLDPGIVPGGLIYTPGYDKPRGRRHLPLKLSVEDCKILLEPLVWIVSTIRKGTPLFTPSAAACQYCKVRPYTRCLSLYKGVYQ